MLNHYPLNSSILFGVNTPVTSTSVVTAICKAQEGLPFPKFLAGGRGGQGGTTYALFSKASTYTLNIWRSALYSINGPFNITEIILPLSTNLSTNHIITPVLYLDNGGTTVMGTAINTSNYPDNPKSITLTAADFSYNVHGENNFLLQLNFTGTALIDVTLPIIITLETEEVG